MKSSATVANIPLNVPAWANKDVVETWTEGHQILFQEEHKGMFIVVGCYPGNSDIPDSDKYQMMCFFNIGDRTEVSVDVDETSPFLFLAKAIKMMIQRLT